MTAFAEFKAARGSGKDYRITNDMATRWANRIVAQGLCDRGRAGAADYLSRYGKGIGVQKLVDLALTCEMHVFDSGDGARAMANYFWETAYEAQTGEKVPQGEQVAAAGQVAVGGGAPTPALPAPQPDAAYLRTFEIFPPHLRPGALITMQPVDAAHGREYYVSAAGYIGQPKRDGSRLVVFATPDAVAYQGRSQQLKDAPSAMHDEILRQVAHEIGPFVLDCELWFPDAAGGEHRTSAQAAAANRQLGWPKAIVTPMLAIFEALYWRGGRLTDSGAMVRMNAGQRIAECLLDEYGSDIRFEFLKPAVTTAEKQALVAAQAAEGREGEVWRRADAPYVGGKQTGRAAETSVRTKHGVTRTVAVTGFTATGAVKVARQFAAMQVCDPQTGAALGSVGTGFTQADQQALLDGFVAAQDAGRPFLIEIYSRGATGLTEGGQLYQASFEGIVWPPRPPTPA